MRKDKKETQQDGQTQAYAEGNTSGGKYKALRGFIAVIVAVLIALIAFVAGYYMPKSSNNGQISSYQWAVNTILENYYGDIDMQDAGELSLKALASKLDIYSEYYTAEEYAKLLQSNSGEKSGIGITYNYLEGKGAYIVTVEGNSPAYKAGLEPGDLVISGQCGDEKTTFDVSGNFEAFLTRRATDEVFTLSTAEKDFSLSRQVYRASYTCMYTNKMAWWFESNEDGDLALCSDVSARMDYLPDDSAYVKLSQFYGTAAGEFEILMKNFNASNCTSLILDLRNNGGGYVSVMQSIAGQFSSAMTDKNCVAMTAKYNSGKEEVYYTYRHSEGLVPFGTKVYVLANSGTASASEALIGALISYGYLKYEDIYLSLFSDEYYDFVGRAANDRIARSYGKGIMQSTFINQRTGEALKLTTAQIYWPNGKCIHGVGLRLEDGCKASPAEWTATKGDTELQNVVKTIFG